MTRSPGPTFVGTFKLAESLRRTVADAQALGGCWLEEARTGAVAVDGRVFVLVVRSGQMPGRSSGLKGEALTKAIRAAGPRVLGWRELEVDILPEPWPSA